MQGIPTIPSTLQEELDTNPFLRPNDPAIRKNLGQCPCCVVLMAAPTKDDLPAHITATNSCSM